MPDDSVPPRSGLTLVRGDAAEEVPSHPARLVQPGTRLGPYEIVSRIGAGGMGEVWRARDARLGREVAIKILPADFAEDARLKIRFEREAKTISQLSHPNICTLFDVGENYLVMELLDGESLAERLTRGPLSLNEVVRYGVQLAEALGKAHHEGVVHRDLKPGNVVLTKGGAKLLDFGLAKSTAVADSPTDATVQKPLTQEGTVLGTFQYMSPEQLAGEEPDARSDIFSLGAVLYEMTTGKRAFEGKSRTSLVSAIVSGEPRAMRDLQPMTPPALEHVILKCLAKDRDDRWQSASDIAEELRWISQAGSQTGVAAVIIRKRRWREWLMAIITAASLSSVAVVGWLLWRRAPSEQPAVESSISMEPTGGIGGTGYWGGPPAFSPDGKTFTFAADDKNGRRMLWVRSLDTSTPQALANTEGAVAPFWSPDGKFIAFLTTGKLERIPSSGGEPDVIANADIEGGGTWNRDGVILYSRGVNSPLYRIAPGGEAAAVLDPQSFGAVTLRWPQFLPDGNHFLVFATAKAPRVQAGVWICRLDGKESPRFLTAAGSHATYVEPGWLLFERDGVLRAQRLDPKTLRLSGDSNPIAPVQTTFRRYAIFAASANGVLVYQKPGSIQLTELQLRNGSGAVLRTLGRGSFCAPTLSKDGRRVAVDQSDESGSGDIWIFDAENASRARLSFGPMNETSPVWSPDNRTVAYQGRPTSASPQAGIVANRAGGVAEMLLDLPGSGEGPTDWSPDGRFIALHRFGHRPDGDVLVFSVATRTVTDVATTPADEAAAVFSPDSRWIAYQSDESGRYEVYVQPFPPTGAKYQISTSGGRYPRWRVPGTIHFVDENDHLSAVRAETANGLSVDPPETLPLVIDTQGVPNWTNYDIAANGNVLVNSTIRENPPPLTLVTNWTRRLQTAAKK